MILLGVNFCFARNASYSRPSNHSTSHFYRPINHNHYNHYNHYRNYQNRHGYRNYGNYYPICPFYYPNNCYSDNLNNIMPNNIISPSPTTVATPIVPSPPVISVPPNPELTNAINELDEAIQNLKFNLIKTNIDYQIASLDKDEAKKEIKILRSKNGSQEEINIEAERSLRDSIIMTQIEQSASINDNHVVLAKIHLKNLLAKGTK